MIGHLDCSSGMSGDKLLGALLDAGAPGDVFTPAHLQSLVTQFASQAKVVVERTFSHSISAVRVSASATDQPPSRTWASIREQLLAAELPSPVRDRALSAFALLAEAEAAVHGTAPEDVHFHEVGGLDSVLDVVGSCLGLHLLGIERLFATPVATGWGSVRSAHGELPVPAPATALLLLGVPVVAGPHASELTTPTGAALVRACVDAFEPLPASTPLRVGYGAGTRNIGTPNVCRLLVADPTPSRVALAHEQVGLLETNIDHISPEAAAVAAEQLLAEGALDVWIQPITMKKGRSAFSLNLLVPAEQTDDFAERVIALTGSLGVRTTRVERRVAERETFEARTSLGPVRFKAGAGRSRPEADDVARIARERGESFGGIAQDLTDEAR